MVLGVRGRAGEGGGGADGGSVSEVGGMVVLGEERRLGEG